MGTLIVVLLVGGVIVFLLNAGGKSKKSVDNSVDEYIRHNAYERTRQSSSPAIDPNARPLTASPELEQYKQTKVTEPIDSDCMDYSIEIVQAWGRGDYDWARQQLQKIAYGMVGRSVTDKQRDDFTQLMTQFASEDPGSLTSSRSMQRSMA